MKNIDILFKEQTHEYLINNIKAKTSVTALIEKQVSKSNFYGVDPVILAKAAERGTRVHRELELFIKNGTEPTTPEAIGFKKYVEDNNWVFDKHQEEFKVAIEWQSRTNPNNSFILAGTADLITLLNNEPIMVDHKTTSVIHKQDVSWQLSLLDYMARKLDGCTINGVEFNYIKASKFFVFHFNKSAEFNPVEVRKISDIEIERLLDAEANGEEYFPLPTDILTPRQQEELLYLEQQIVQLEQSKKELESKREILKKALLDGFSLHPDITSIKTNSFSISYIPGRTDRVLDSSRLQEEEPEIASKYQKDRTTKPQVRITLSKSLKNEIPIISSGGVLTIDTPKPKKTIRTKAKKDYFD